jgi:membrane protease YdiL (CAAX protease family)
VNIAALIFLVVLFVLTPRAALRTARQLRAAHAQGTPIPRTRLVLSTMFSLTVLWFLAQMNALSMERNLFALPVLGLREAGIGLAGFALLLLAIPAARYGRSPEEERRRLLYSVAPRTPREYAVFCILGLMAGIAEEAAYRGVAVWILQPVFGGLAPAVFLSAMAFSVAHAVQGGRAMAVIFAIALVFHAVVYFTNTLVVAMVIHAAYDCVAGLAAGRRARALAAEDAGKAPTPVSAG